MQPNQILHGDVREMIKQIPDQFVNCVVTSPPYWGLRDYGLPPLVWADDPECRHWWSEEKTVKRGHPGDKSTLVGTQTANLSKSANSQGEFCRYCNAWRGSLGLEPTPELYVKHLVTVFRELRRVLRDDGTLWLNLGDSYAANRGRGDSGMGIKQASNPGSLLGKLIVPPGLKPKDLVGIPWRVAFALQADGWYLRSDIIWHKPNAMPESVKDRPTKAHEYLFLLTKSKRYYYDADVIKEKHKPESLKRYEYGQQSNAPNDGLIKAGSDTGAFKCQKKGNHMNYAGRNRRTVWTIPTQPYRGAHFATFPPKLIEPCILAGCSLDGIVLDPFFGSGTVAQVCIQTKRNWLGIELNPDYIELAHKRIAKTQPTLFAPQGA